jgi:acetyl-CoA carboxylase beta subunit
MVNDSPKHCDFEVRSREDLNELLEKRNELNVLIDEKSKEQIGKTLQALSPLEKEQLEDFKNKIKILQQSPGTFPPEISTE